MRERAVHAINMAPHKHDGYVIRTARSRRARLFPLTIEVGPIATDGCDVTVHQQSHSAKSMKYLTALLIPSVVHESAPRRKFISREVPLLARTRELDPRVPRQLSNFCDISLRYPLSCIAAEKNIFVEIVELFVTIWSNVKSDTKFQSKIFTPFECNRLRHFRKTFER